MIGVKCSDPYGMCVPLLDAGYEVHLLTQRRRMIERDVWTGRLLEQRFTREDANLAVFGVGENKKRALSRGLKVEYGAHGSNTPVELPALGCGDGYWR